MTDYCKTCKHDKDIGFCDKCFYNHVLEERGIPPTEYEANSKPTTNYDRLRAMSVEEMAEFMKSSGASCPDGHFVGDYDCKDCKNCWLDWLREEVSTDG